MRKHLLYFFISLIIFATGTAQNYKQVKIYISDRSDVQYLQNAGMQFDHLYYTKDNAITVFIDEQDYSILQSTGFNYEILIDDWITYYENLPKLTEKEKQEFIHQSKEEMNVGGFGFGSMGGFYILSEVNAELDSMRLLYPNLITAKTSIGNSIENRAINMVKISDNPDVNENEPQVLYTALHHAREPQSMMQMIYFMYYLLENYGTDPRVTFLVNNREMYFIPVLNPDGYEYNRQTDPNGGGWWRKNRRNNGGSFGVDLNRNYGPFAYWNSSNGGSSTDPSSDTYRGTAPFSEPETTSLKNFLGTKNLSCALNYHTYGNYLIFPYGALPYLTPDSLIFFEFSGDMTSYNGYSAGTALQTVGYGVRGISDDYFYDGDVVLNHGKIFAMTPEVGTTGFWPSQSEIFPLAIENVEPNLYYAFVAGEYIALDNPNYGQQYFNPGDVVQMNPSFRNKGLSTGYNIDVELNSLNSFVTINNGTSSIDSIPARTSVNVSSPFSFTISSSAPAEEVVDLEFVISLNSIILRKDTISFIIGTPQIIFADTTNSILNLWTITATPTNPRWEATTTTFYSAPNSYTDSRLGNYVDNATVTMTLTNPINLSQYNNPRFTFWTKYDIESNWDYGQVKVTTNNGATWFPLDGYHTEPGVGSFQPNGEPLYDGIKSNWVREEMSLSGFTSSQVKFRFQLRTDGAVVRDGWYVDDIAVIVYIIIPVELTSFSAITGSDQVILNWSTATELNNLGFEIQRSANINDESQNRNWQTLVFVEGSGTTTESQNYSFTDRNPSTGISYYRLKQIDFDGTYRLFDEVKVTISSVTEYELAQNYPNPFNPKTTINYSIPVSGHVSLKVYNLLGSEVAVLVDKTQEAGRHSVEFSTEKLGTKIGSGVYLYTLKSGEFVRTRKMIVLK